MDTMNRNTVDSLASEIGIKLKKFRNGKGLTQKELAAKIENGVDYTYIGKIERGQQLPSLKVLHRICETFSIPISYFFSEESETVVYVNCPVDFRDMARDEKGSELLKALKLVHPTDIPLIVEIIHILSRHRYPDMVEQLRDSVALPGEAIPAAKNKILGRKSKY